MNFREAKNSDIEQIKLVRNSVKENKLSNPNSISDEEYSNYLTVKGKAWVCEYKKQIIGFAVVDNDENSIWALYVAPRYTDQGVGKQLHNMMLNWYFQQTKTPICVETEFDTRAEDFFKWSNWEEIENSSNEYAKFEMTWEQWQNS